MDAKLLVMQNDLVLKEIFRHLHLKELLLCRLVCKTWCNNPWLIELIGERSKIIVNYPVKAESSDLGNYELSESFPFRNFSISSIIQLRRDDTKIQSPTETQYLDRLLTNSGPFLALRNSTFLVVSEALYKFSPFITKLEIYLDSKSMDSTSFKNLLLYQLPYLSKLHIYGLSEHAVYAQGFVVDEDDNLKTKCPLKSLVMEETRNELGKFMKQFFEVFGDTIEEVIVQCNNRRDWDTQRGIWKEHSPATTSILKGLFSIANGKPLPLCKISCGILNDQQIRILLKLGTSNHLKLSSLNFYCLARDTASEDFTTFLETQSSTLKILHILGNIEKVSKLWGCQRVGIGNVNSYLRFPKMARLEELKLSNREKDLPPFIYPINYKTQLPALRKLIVNGHAMDIKEKMTDFFPPNYEACPGVPFHSSCMEVTLPSFTTDPVIIQNTYTWFPNLCKISLKYPSNDLLCEIWKCFINSKLSCIKILADADSPIEPGLLGLSLSDYDRLLVSNSLQGFPGNKSFLEYDSGIASVKTLRHLEIIVESELNQLHQCITELLIHHALVKMTQLRKLALLSCCWFDGFISCNYVSNESQLLLKSKLIDTVLIFEPLILGVCCCCKNST